jgi:SAM-dependent methyltransferase
VGVDWDWLRGHRDDLVWPGDEWGNPELWESIYQSLFVDAAGVEAWKRAVEIGQGSGKYTLKVLGNPGVQVRAYDVSAAFLDICRRRCEQMIEEGRLSLHHLDAMVPDHLLSDLTAAGWRRQVDGLYSIDAMVHVDLQYMAAYLITAAAVLRPGGKLVLTLASPTTDAGFELLLEGIHGFWEAQASVHGSGKMEWVSASIMEALLPRLGFQIDLMEQPPGWPILLLVASLREPEKSEAVLPYLEQSSN